MTNDRVGTYTINLPQSASDSKHVTVAVTVCSRVSGSQGVFESKWNTNLHFVCLYCIIFSCSGDHKPQWPHHTAQACMLPDSLHYACQWMTKFSSSLIPSWCTWRHPLSLWFRLFASRWSSFHLDTPDFFSRSTLGITRHSSSRPRFGLSTMGAL